MITLATKFDILHSHFINGDGLKTIASELSISKNTVKKYVREFSEQKAEIIAGGDKTELLSAMNEKPTYKTENRERTAMTDEMIEIIQNCLLENENKKHIGNSKLCMKSIDIQEK